MRLEGRHGWVSVGAALLMMGASHLPAARAADARSETPWLGVYTQELTPELREGMNHDGDGVLVTRVVQDSPAERAGIRKGDIIVRVNSRLVDSPDELSRIVRAGRAGDQVAVQIERDGERQTLTARLSAAKEEGLKEGEEDSEAPEAGESKHSQETPDSDFDYDFDNDFDVDGGSVEIPGRGFTMIGGGRGRLGVRIETLNPGLGDYFGVKDGKGVLVVEVLKDTPAERAGMKAGDVIVRLDDRDVNDSDDLVRAIRSSKDGKVTIDVVRHSAPRTLEAQLRAAPQAPRVMRLRRPGEGGVRTWSWSGAPDRDDLRRELLDLREELREMKKELEELRKR